MFLQLEEKTTIIGGTLGGGAGGAIGAVILSLTQNSIGVPLQRISHHPIPVILWGALIGLGLTTGTGLHTGLNLQDKNLRTLLTILFGALGGTITGSFCGYLISSTLAGGAVLGLIFSFWISIEICLLQSFLSGRCCNVKRFLLYTILVCLAGGLGVGSTGGILWAFLAKGAHAEGYVLLAGGLFTSLGVTLGVGIIAGIFVKNCYSNNEVRNLTLAGSIAFILFILFGVWKIVSYSSMKSNVFNIYKDEDVMTIADVFPLVDKKTIIKMLMDSKDWGLGEVTALYKLTKNQKFAREVKNILLKECRQRKFTHPAHSIKAQQFDAAKRGVSYITVVDIDNLFSSKEKDELINWFKDIVNRTFSIEWVDYLYAIAFKRSPRGPYENQEIGVGALSVLAQIIEEKYPEVAKKSRDYIKKYAVVWGGNFRNTDDSVGYQSWWIYSAFLVGKYLPVEEWLNNENAKNSFEWLLKQWPSNGLTLGYNDYHPKNIADTMALGASLFNDGRYKWLAVKMLEKVSLEFGFSYPFYFGLTTWDDSLPLVRPHTGSVYLMGPGNLPHDPGPMMPDKIVFREGWEEDSLYALLNLRYSGWHKYKATNSFVNIIYGRPFVVEDSISKRHKKWLPAGRALYRDKKIDRSRLNGLQVGLEGYELLTHNVLQLGTPWAQDPPRYSEVEYFQQTSEVDYSKTLISDWRGWDHERISLLVKNRYFAVFDKVERDRQGRVAISWHLRGFKKAERDRLDLEQKGYQMKVYYPHHDDWYQVDLKDSLEKDLPAGDINAPDVDFYMTSEEKSKVGFVTIFAPMRQRNSYKVKQIDVRNLGNQPVYPDALGIKLENKNRKEIIGIAFKENTFLYDHVSTDAELFLLSEDVDKNLSITYKNGSFLEIDFDDKEFSEVALGKHKLKVNEDWRYHDGRLMIKLPECSGKIYAK